MESKDLKKFLAGFGIAGLIAGAGLAAAPNAARAADQPGGSGWVGSKGSAVSTEKKAPMGEEKGMMEKKGTPEEEAAKAKKKKEEEKKKSGKSGWSG